MKTLLTPGKDTELIGLDLADLAQGETLELTRDEEVAAVVLSGVVDVDGLGTAGGRGGVFDGPGHTVYAPPGHRLTFRATGGPAQIVIATAPLGDGTPGEARIIGPDDQEIAERGEGNWSRTVRTILGPGDSAGRLLLGETINPPGNWSSYPPHKHDTHEPPREVKLEEVYLFKLDPENGFGVQIRYDGEGEECFTVRDGDVAAIPAGYHPVVAAPGYRLCYLWVMAGQGRQMIPYLDPEHAWVQNG
ncbi:5-deoxy-glucuronate isomerase [Actinoallomurus rhizosphaericola]|uniref:5-deoxy-glucuronate isomerase n=1 Tax=Actinoallomurus rhizosphaericola TaxID=2952536 RepID=UPI002093886D|nr:5-deoxy-glucuronate isomerase [Actinoallomurus rhizosphaericola]MCO5999940.1 5-deoxy-glucuronate isomerase [Actinoallomurus rhizosphaericola]